jgi:putative RNA 2'-phosphotransferase
MKQISKLISYVLRHKPEELGLTLDVNGWVEVDDLLRAIQTRHPNFHRADLDQLVRESDKSRFIIEGSRIRANQGHSVEVDLNLQPQTPPNTLYHGTSQLNLPLIQRDGISKMARHHVHLSPDLETAKIVGSRRKGQLVILSVDSGAMASQGLEFFRSDNGVWLTSHVDPKWISIHELI